MIGRVAIVGASAAGISAARTLRACGFDGSITLIDAEPRWPYQRPELSKRLFETPPIAPADIPLLTEQAARDLRLDVLLGERAIALDAGSRRLSLKSGATLSNDAVLLATGGIARRLPVPGMDLEGVHTLRDFEDVVALREHLADADSIAVIGGGLIGAEIAAAAMGTGRRVCWLDAAPKPLTHVLPDAIADYLIDAHRRLGVELRSRASIRALAGHAGCLQYIELADGSRIPAQVAVIGVGMMPNDTLAREAGLAVSSGVDVDEEQRTAAFGVFAAGDMAAVLDPILDRRRRQEHWQAAEEQGANVARVMLGEPCTPASVPWFWSDQGSHHVEMTGVCAQETVLRMTQKGPVAFQLQAGRLVGVAAVDEIQAVRIGKRLIQSAISPARELLADPTVELRKLLSSQRIAASV